MRRGNSCYILHILVAWFTLYIRARKYGRGGGGYYGHFCPFRFVAASKKGADISAEKNGGKKGWSESIFSGLFFLSSSFSAAFRDGIIEDGYLLQRAGEQLFRKKSEPNILFFLPLPCYDASTDALAAASRIEWRFPANIENWG